MAKILGREYDVGIGREGSGVRGTAVAPQFWIPLRAFDFDTKVSTVVDGQSRGVIEGSTDVTVVNKWAEGTFEGRVRLKSIGLLLLNVFGTINTDDDTPASGEYTHTFTVQQGHQHPSFSLGSDDPVTGDMVYPLCMLRRLELKAELGEFVVFLADSVSKQGESLTLTPAYTAEDEFTAVDVEFYEAATAVALATANPSNIKSVSIVFETGVGKDDVLGKVDPDDILNATEGAFQATIEITKAYENTTFKDYYEAGTGRAIRVKIQDSGNEKIQIDFNQVKMTGWERSSDLDGMIIETLTYVANFKIADSKMVQAVLVNTQSSYVAEGAGGGLSAKAEIA